MSELARCIAFHELNEVILGDMPAYTNLSQSKMNTADLYAWKRLKDISKREREHVANEFISMFLGERERKSLQKVNQYFSDDTSPISQLVNVLDKVDPIINVWRYLHHYRGQLDEDADAFLRRMKDFFDYPEVKEVTKKYNADRKMHELVLILQDRDLARLYYRDRRNLGEQGGLFSLPSPVIHELIEGRKMVFTIARGTGRRRSSI
jgi:5'-deoxynucleotidase YfbR-like HD superfamily hydrolase